MQIDVRRAAAVIVAGMVLLAGCATPGPTTPSARAEELAQAEAATSAFYQVVENRDFAGMEALFSDYSLHEIAGILPADAAAEWAQVDAAGYRLLEHQVLDSRLIAENVAMVQVSLRFVSVTGAQEQTTEVWAGLRKEDGQWRVNYANFIDHVDLDLTAQTMHGVTVRPWRIVRATDALFIVISVENETDRGVYWGWGDNSTVATFTFDEGNVEAGWSWYLSPHERVADVKINVDGWRETYPTGVDLSNWFLTFEGGNIDESVEPWTYRFSWD